MSKYIEVKLTADQYWLIYDDLEDKIQEYQRMIDQGIRLADRDIKQEFAFCSRLKTTLVKAHMALTKS